MFRHYAQFAAINPVVKAPTLVLADRITPAAYPALAGISARAESRPEFLATPPV